MAVEEIGIPLGETEEVGVRKDALGGNDIAKHQEPFVSPGETGDPVLDQALNQVQGELSDEDKEKLSKALFPDTHTNVVEILGKERTLRPTTLKYSRQIYASTKEISDKIRQSGDVSEDDSFKNLDDFEKDFDDVVVKTLLKVVRCLCDFYGEDWNDIKVAVSDEDISLVDLQTVVRTQQELNTTNDFFLQPLRGFVRMLQVREIAMLLTDKLVTTSTLRQS